VYAVVAATAMQRRIPRRPPNPKPAQATLPRSQVDRTPPAAPIALTGRSMRRDMRLQGKSGQGRTALFVMAILIAIIVVAVLYSFVYAR
jgi:hypothetical protein